MHRSHLAVGACAAALAGAVSGASIDTTPLARGIDAWDRIPHHEFTEAELEIDARSEALPDHYPLITPEGRFEVGELRDRGLYSNRRFGMVAGWSDWPEAADPAYQVSPPGYSYLPPDAGSSEPAGHDVRREAEDARPELAVADTEPLETSPPVAAVRPAVIARTIDISAALASRN